MEKKSGFTLVELLIVVALLAILAIGAYTGWQLQVMKARDARRKSDLNNLSVAIRSYAEDFNCYPKEEDLVCGSDFLDPYLLEIPCDPINSSINNYYYYRPSCQAFIYYTRLENVRDKVIETLRCDGGCGPGGVYNYYVTDGDIFPEYVPPTPTPSPMPTPTPIPDIVVPNCGSEVPYCFANECGTCCPGNLWRCNGAGNMCIRDETCQ